MESISGLKRHWSVGDWAGLAGGYRWLPTPVPSSQQTTAYLDNHRHIVSMGHTFELQKLTLGFAGQMHHLRPQQPVQRPRRYRTTVYPFRPRLARHARLD